MEGWIHETLSGFVDIKPFDGVEAPTTKFPALDIYDHGLDRPLCQPLDDSHSFSIKCTSKAHHESRLQCPEKTILSHLARYVHFIVGLTGQNAVSILCDITIALHNWQGIIVGERMHGWGKRCYLRSMGSKAKPIPVTDFSYSFNSAENYSSGSLIHSFVSREENGTKFDVTLPRDGMPKASIESLRAQIQHCLDTPENSSEPRLENNISILPRCSPKCQSKHKDPLDESNLHAMFESQAMQNPDCCAIEFLQPEAVRGSPSRLKRLSYEELNTRCENIARTLRKLFDADGDQSLQNHIVPVFAPTSPELYIAYLAILKAGCAFCPLPVDAPSQRLREIVGEIQPLVVLGLGSEPDSGPWYEASRSFRTTWLDVESCVQYTRGLPLPRSSPDFLAYVMFTSGSSGRPKGVRITHRAATASITAHMKQYQEIVSYGLPMRWYQFAAPTFDPSIMEIFVTLSCGGTLCGAPRETTLTTPEAAITETRSTITMATPSLVAMLDIHRLPTLNYLWTMGETLSRQVIGQFAQSDPRSSEHLKIFHPKITLCNAYGPTEAAINVTFFPNVPQHMRGSIIGYPLESARLLVIDPEAPNIRPVPLGFVGELAISGAQVGLGYIREPQKDSPAFVQDDHYGRLYRTGDLARVVWDSNSTPLLEFLGRISDDQVKINGQRVELGDVESILCTIPAIRSSVAILEQTSNQQHSLVACLLLEPEAKSFSNSIEERCREVLALSLPSYMRPTKFLFVDQLAKTSAGKVDRREVARIARGLQEKMLKSIMTEQGRNTEGVERTPSGIEQNGDSRLSEALSEALRETTGAVSGSLKDVLDSLSALRFLRNIKKKGINNISLKDVLHAEAIESLAQLINSRPNAQNSTVNSKEERIPVHLRSLLDKFRARWQPDVQRHFDLAVNDIQDVLPTTEIQSRILLSFSNRRVKSAIQRPYIHHSLHSFRQKININQLKIVWRHIVQKHDAYRTVFMPIDDEISPFAQIILSPTHQKAQPRWLEVCSDEAGGDRELYIECALQEAEKLIELDSPTPVLTLVKSEKQLSILLSMFHSIFDLASLQMLLADICAALEGRMSGHRKELRTAVEAHFFSQSATTDAFWDDYLYRQETLLFPSLTPVRREATLGVTLGCQITSKLAMNELETRCRNLLCSPLSAFQAAWSAVLLAYTSPASSEVIFGSVLADRIDGDRSICVAPSFTVVPTRTKADKSSRNLDILTYLSNGNLQAMRHLHSSIQSKRSRTRSYDTTIALQMFQEPDNLKDIWRDTIILPMAHDYALMIEVVPDANGRICFKAVYNDSYLDQNSAELMLHQLDEIVTWILTNPMLPFYEASSSLEERKLSILNPDPKIDPEKDSILLHTQFELNSCTRPDRTALEYWYDLDGGPGSVQRWSYREINDKASRLAESIMLRFGDVLGVIIPILMKKQPELYLAVLAVLKTGAAWTPIDFNSPPRRRLDLIRRIGAKLIIISQDANIDTAGIPKSVEVVRVSMQVEHECNIGLNDSRECQPLSVNSPAYLVWTSGTTGAPKGVTISHKAACASMKALQASIPYENKAGSPARCLQFAQQTFDVFVQDLFCTWGAGGTVISASTQIITSSFSSLSRKSQSTHAHLTPTFAATLQRDFCPTLEVITMIGEKLHQYVADDWGRNTKAFNTYGPAEAAVVSTLSEFSAGSKPVKSSNIGRPLPSVSCRVIRDGKIVMTQGVGELALGGPQIADGYLKDLERTGNKFIKYEFTETELYLTGDIVRHLADGTLEFIGREDDLVKLGGIRVELSEISHAMMDCHDTICQIETFHLSRHDRPTKGLVSFVAANIEQDAERYIIDGYMQPICTAQSAEIARCAMRRARQSLPDYMVPSIIVILQSIPKTSSAKVDRDALENAYDHLDLRLWETIVWGDESEIHDELSDNALKLRKCLSQFSGAPLETIHLHSSLHSLGIDSLSAARFVQYVSKFDMDLQITDILQISTVGQALQIARERNLDHSAPMEPNASSKSFSKAWLPQVQLRLGSDVSFVMPTTPLQEGVLSESILDRTSYWSNHFFKLTSSVIIEKLNFAWSLVSVHTEALRTHFLTLTEIAHAGTLPSCLSSFLLVVLEKPSLDWAEIDVRTDLENTAKERADHVSLHHQKTLFRQPPWAVSILNEGSNRYMMLTIHHSIHDNESINILVKNLAAAYHGLELSKACQITNALSASIHHANRNEHENYWFKLLNPFRDVSLPQWPDLIGRDRSVQRKHSRTTISERMDMGLKLGEATEIAHGLRTSCSTIFKVAFGCMLLDYLESSAVVFGEILSQRFTNPEYRNVVAPLITVKPVPFAVKNTAMELITEQCGLSARSSLHESLSGPLMRKILGRTPKEPLYSAVFAFHPPEEISDSHSNRQSDLWYQRKDILSLSVEHDIALNVYANADSSLNLELTAKDCVMDQEGVKILCQQLKTLNQAILRNPSRYILGLLDDADYGILSISKARLDGANNDICYTKSTYWLEYHAEYHPDWIAVEVASSILKNGAETERWTFKQLFRESCKIAEYIRGQGYKGNVIAVCTGRTLQSYATIAGIFMSGNIYLPIDDNLPQQRKLLLLEDSDCSLLMTDSACIQALHDVPSDCRVLNIDETLIREKFQQMSDNISSSPDPDESAYLIYTSGSTGKPKGVLISHRSLCGFVGGLTRFMSQASTLAGSKAGVGKWLGLASRAFDVHLAEMFLAWRSGLAAVTAPREVLLDDLRLALTTLKVTHACFVPSLLEQVELEPDQIPDFVFMTIGGERLSKRIIDTWAGQARITAVNAYGPTELAIGCTAAHIVPNLNPSNIGFPYGNTIAHILIPRTLHYAKKGQAGELCFTGCLVGNGYLNRPDAKGFVDNFRGQRMYRTGDMARMHADGSLTYLGRGDDQTKLRGQRIELSEVSETIRDSSKIPIEVVTLLVDHSELSSTFLISFISDVAERAKRYDANPSLAGNRLREIAIQSRQYCRENLPAFMVPEYVIPVDVLPLARISGKADAKPLKALFDSLSVSELLRIMGEKSNISTGVKRQLSPREKKVAAIIQDVLKLGQEHSIEPQANLLALGLDSLNAVGLILKFREIGLNLNLGSLLGSPTIEAIVARGNWSAVSLPQVMGSAAMNRGDILGANFFDPKDILVPETAVEKVLPCLPVQENTVTATLTSESSYPYINHILYKLHFGIDLERFKMSWLDLVTARPILRTIFIFYNDNFVQLVLRPEAICFPWKEMSHAANNSKGNLISNAIRVADEEISQEIQQRPPLRLHLITEHNVSPVFIVSIHHALYDAESFEMMMEELWLHYNKQAVPRRMNIEPLLDYRAAEKAAMQKLFWQQYLNGSRQTRLCQDPTLRNKLCAPLHETFKLDLSSIRTLASNLEVTLSALTQYLFAVTLARKLKSRDILFGLTLSGRSLPIKDVGLIVAPCVTTIPQRFQILSNANLFQSLRQTQAQTANCLEHQHTSLRDISQWTDLPLPMFDALFSFKYEDGELHKTSGWTQLDSSMVLDYPLAVEYVANKESNLLSITCAYTAAFGARADADLFVEDMQILLIMIQNGDNQKISSLGVFEQAIDSNANVPLWDEETWSMVENRIKKVVQEFKGIQIEGISKNISFFQLGIDSVSAIRLAKLFRKNNLTISPANIMRYSSVGSLGNYLSSKSITTSKSVDGFHVLEKPHLWRLVREHMQISAGDIEAVYECTPLQAGMITSTLASGGAAYVHQHTHMLPRDVNITRFREAWATTVQALDILRTSFFFTHNRGQHWIACVHSNTYEVSLDCIETPDSSQVDNPIKFLTAEDFKRPPVCAIIAHNGKESLLYLTLHHALYDGNSLPMIFEVLSRAYNDVELKPWHKSPFYDIARTINERASLSKDFWLETLKGYRNADTHQTDRSPTQLFLSRKSNVSQIEALKQCEGFGVTLQSVLLVAFAKVLAMLSHTRDVAFGHVVSGRSIPDIDCEDIIGPMFNTVPLRIHFENLLMSNQNVVDRILNFTTEAYAHHHASLAQVQSEWRSADGRNNSRLFDSIFSYQKSSSNPPSGFWHPLKTNHDLDSSEYCLNFEFEQTTTYFVLTASCHEGCLVQGSLSELLDIYEEILKNILHNPTQKIGSSPQGLSNLPAHKADCKLIRYSKNEEGDDNEMIQTVKMVLSQVSGVPVDEIANSQSLFSLGLTSLSAITVAAECRRKGLELSVSDILQGVTATGIYRFIAINSEQAKVGTNGMPQTKFHDLLKPPVNEDCIESMHPALSGQIYHLVNWLRSGKTLYMPTWSYACPKIDPRRFHLAWKALRKRHPILRSIFAASSRIEAVQIVLKEDFIAEDYFNCSSGATDLQSIREYVKAEQRKPADMKTPPIRIRVVQGPTHDVVLLTIHHALYDAWSLPVILTDLENLYNGSDLDTLPNWLQFVEQSIGSVRSLDESSFWKKSLNPYSRTVINNSIRGIKNDFIFRPENVFVSLPNAITNVSSHSNLCRGYNVSLPTVFILCFARSLASAANVANPVFGMFSHGRNSSFPNLSHVTGPCLNMLPIVVRSPFAEPWYAKAQEIQRELGARLPFEQSMLSHVLQWAQEVGQEPLEFNTFINILWSDMPRETSLEAMEGKNFLRNIDIGVPSEFVSKIKVGADPSIEDLSWPLSNDGIYIDIALSKDGESINIGGRIEGRDIAIEVMRSILIRVSVEAKKILDSP